MQRGKPEGSLAQRQERGSRKICFGRGKKNSPKQLKRSHGVEADGSRLQASDDMPGEAAARKSPDLRESQMFHKRWNSSIERRKVEVCSCNV